MGAAQSRKGHLAPGLRRYARSAPQDPHQEREREYLGISTQFGRETFVASIWLQAGS
jgi:hypothetical protein